MPRGMMLDLNDAIVRRIKELCKQNNWTAYRLGTEAGLSAQYVRTILGGKHQQVSVQTIKKICDACEITLAAFFSAAYFENLPME